MKMHFIITTLVLLLASAVAEYTITIESDDFKVNNAPGHPFLREYPLTVSGLSGPTNKLKEVRFTTPTIGGMANSSSSIFLYTTMLHGDFEMRTPYRYLEMYQGSRVKMSTAGTISILSSIAIFPIGDSPQNDGEYYQIHDSNTFEVLKGDPNGIWSNTYASVASHPVDQLQINGKSKLEFIYDDTEVTVSHQIGTGEDATLNDLLTAIESATSPARVSETTTYQHNLLNTTFSAPKTLYFDGSDKYLGSQLTDNSTQKVTCLGYKLTETNADGVYVETTSSATSYRPTSVNDFTILWLFSEPEFIGESVEVTSAFGKNKVTPPVGRTDVGSGTYLSFKAPEFVYLDEYYQELDGDADDLVSKAHHRARCLGYVTNITTIDAASTSFDFGHDVTESFEITWVWELQHAFFVRSDTSGVPNLPEGDAKALGNPAVNGVYKSIGRVWIKDGELVDLSIDGQIEVGNEGVNTNIAESRFTIDQYKIKGLTGIRGEQHGNEQIPAGTTSSKCFVSSPTTRNFTEKFDDQFPRQNKWKSLSFWAKFETQGGSGEKEGIFDLQYTAGPLGHVICYRDGTSIYVKNLLTNSPVLTFPAQLLDNSWHHWSISQVSTDYRNGITVITRDGQIISQAEDILFMGETFFNNNSHDSIVLGEAEIDGVTYSSNALFYEVSYIRGEVPASDNSSNYFQEQLESIGLLQAKYPFASWEENVADLQGATITGVSHISDTGDSVDEFPNEKRLLVPEDYTHTFETSPSRVQTLQFPMLGSVEMDWIWDKQFQYLVNTHDVANSETTFDNEPYLRVYPAYDSSIDATEEDYYTRIKAGSVTPEQEYNGSGSHWIDQKKAVVVGTSYRRADRRFTLTDFLAEPGGDLSNVGVEINNTRDAYHPTNGRVAREYFVPLADNPTVLNWLYDKTTFRAYVPLGEYVDASWNDGSGNTLDPLPANQQLVPQLPDGARLKVDPTAVTFKEMITEGAPVSSLPYQWDQVSQALHPTQPYVFQVDWDNAENEEEEFNVEIVSGFPTDTVRIPSSRPIEDLTGMRVVNPDFASDPTQPQYTSTVTLAGTSGAFHGSPTAHYSYLFNGSVENTPPLEFDADETDRWAFHSMTYSNIAGVKDVLNASGAPYRLSPTKGERSVLLYNYHPDASGIAVGDPEEEAFVVRVTEGKNLDFFVNSLTTHTPNSTDKVLELGGFGSIQESIGDLPPDGITVDFWAKIDTGALDSEVELVKLKGSNPNQELTLSLKGEQSALGKQEFHWRAGIFHWRAGMVTFATSLGQKNTSRWSHYAITLDAEFYVSVYKNGVKIVDKQSVSDSFGQSLELTFFSGFDQAGWSGQAENLRITKSALEMEDIPQVAESNLYVTYDFDNSIPGVTSGSITTSDHSFYLQEVASPLSSLKDLADMETGWVLNPISNYNANIYDRSAQVGQWGRVFPVNSRGLLRLVYYRLPEDESSIINSSGQLATILHPNVAWPYTTEDHGEVIYPKNSEDKDNRIYIASRIGSEGVDVNGVQQKIFSTDLYDEVSIYNQPDRSLAGYNPNEEHALVAPSVRASLTADSVTNIPPNAVFALQNGLNEVTSGSYTSEPWVLVQYDNVTEGRPDMAAYKVEKVRAGTLPFPVVDPETKDFTSPYPTGTIVEGEVNDFAYQFEYKIKAGDLLVPPYPLNLVIGAAATPGAQGGNLPNVYKGLAQRTLWWDYKGNAYAVSGDGNFFYRFVYPFRSDFHMGNKDQTVTIGDLLPLLPETAAYKVSLDAEGNLVAPLTKPQLVKYTSYWGADYPKLKRGETLTYQGGENKADNPADEGLPAVVAMAASEIVYDSVNPKMDLTNETLNTYGARITRPLDRLEVDLPASSMPTDLQPAATANVMVDGARWYFRNLPGSLSGRFYYDSLEQKLVLRGRLNGLESGDSNLTSAIEALNVLEPNSINYNQYRLLKNYSTGEAVDFGNPWNNAVAKLYQLSQNPLGISNTNSEIFWGSGEGDYVFAQGLGQGGLSPLEEDRWKMSAQWYDDAGENIIFELPSLSYYPLKSFGTGSALVGGAASLLEDTSEPKYITIAENNDERLEGAAVSLHIIELIPDRYRGGLKVIEPADAFSERVEVLHNGEFGGNTQDIYYEWYVREAVPLDVVAKEIPNIGTVEQDPSWQFMAADSGRGKSTLLFEGRPDIALADQFVLMRYRHVDEPEDWNIVSFDSDEVTDWNPGSTSSASPFQWVGAANSPQLQADGSKNYIPQLMMGWIKRVLDRINPYEARYNDFYNNESPATYSSMIQAFGKPFVGSVALNSQKDVIEGVGLIELYETVMKRAKDLTIDNSQPGLGTRGVNQAILLAATRLSAFYDLLGTEAYADFLDSTVTVDSSDTLLADSLLADSTSFVHAFQNLQPNLINEGLALLRGTDFLTSYPSYNRLFWNYTKGLGEAAYNVNYNIQDENLDGFINETDARALYPMGHGDAWGHYLSASKMHYDLLNNSGFSWRSRDELYALLDNVIETDYLDEKSFIQSATRKARAGRDIVAETYRSAYTADPDGQWQGYQDQSADRAWGVGDWGRRAGQAAYFDLVVGNALLPESATASLQDEFDDDTLTAEGLAVIERKVAVSELGELSASLVSIQGVVDQAAVGANPIGLDNESISFDINPFHLDKDVTHFEQVYDKAVEAAKNAVAVTTLAASSDKKLRRIQDDTASLSAQAYDNDLAYRQQLVSIFGRPHPDHVGFGKLYPEGYEGPDLYLYNYIDENDVAKYIPDLTTVDADGNETDSILTQVVAEYKPKGIVAFDAYHDENYTVKNLYEEAYGENNEASFTESSKKAFQNRFNRDLQYYLDASLFPTAADQPTAYGTVNQYYVDTKVLSDIAFVADPNWSNRPVYGDIQQILEEITIAELSLYDMTGEYYAFLDDVRVALHKLENTVELANIRLKELDANQDEVETLQIRKLVADEASIVLETAADILEDVEDIGEETIPGILGFSVDYGAPLKGTYKYTLSAPASVLQIANAVSDASSTGYDFALEIEALRAEKFDAQVDALEAVQDAMANIFDVTGADRPIRYEYANRARNVELLRQKYTAKLNEGYAALKERESFTGGLAADVQSNRYLDMMLRLTRNETQEKHKAAFENAQRYAWLAAKAYEYEVNPSTGSPASAIPLLDEIVKASYVGNMVNGEPTVGGGGLSEVLAMLKANYTALKGQLGINNPQIGEELISLRTELERIDPVGTNDQQWKDRLTAYTVDNLWTMPEFRKYCRPFSDDDSIVQPALVIPFTTTIESRKNFFGHALSAGDHSFSSSNYSTKVAGIGAWFEGYDETGLAASPRVYLVPTGMDFMRTSNQGASEVRSWSLVEQTIPTPYILNETDLSSAGYIPQFGGVDGNFGDIRRYADFRAYPTSDGAVNSSQMTSDTRLLGRSVWNGSWLLIIPGSTLDADPDAGIQTFIDEVSDIKLNFKTFTHRGL